MRRRWSSTTWLTLLVVVLTVIFGGRWALRRAYPLEHRELLFRWASEYNLDPFLVASIIRAESGFKANATSHRGARGLMQIMPDTARWAAEQMKVHFAPELLADPDYNIRLGCWYLATLIREFNGETVLALAAYNAGRTNVRNWLAENRWTGEHATLNQIPFQETRLYVAKVLRDAERYRRIYGP